MTLQAKLRAHLEDADAAWGPDGRDARWTRDGATRLLVLVPRALTASDVVDAHLAGLRDGVAVTVAFDGAATEVARRTAGRLGVELLDAATLPQPPLVEPVADAPAPDAPAADAPAHVEPVEAPLPATPSPAEVVPEAAPEAAVPEVTAPEVEPSAVPVAPAEPMPLLAEAIANAAAVHALVAEPPVPEAPEVEALPVEAPAAEPAAITIPVQEGPAEAPAAEPEPLSVPPLPWADAPREPERLPEVIVAPHEMLALPWVAELEEESVEMLPAGRTPRGQHPTAMGHPTAKGWGLPWSPRGAPPSLVPAASDALSRNEPALWHQAQRVSRLRNAIAETGASSFGAVIPAKAGAVPSPSAWISRLQIERA